MDLESCLRFTVLEEDGEDGAGLSLLSSLLAVSELPEPELTPLKQDLVSP